MAFDPNAELEMMLVDESEQTIELSRCEICLVEVVKAQCSCWEDFLREVVWAEAWEAAEDLLWQMYCEDLDAFHDLYWEA